MGLLKWMFGDSNNKESKATNLESAAKTTTNTSHLSRSRHVIIDSEEQNRKCFSGDTTITEVTLSGSVNAIRQEEFRDCENLKKVQIGNGLKAIGRRAFEGCKNLTCIHIPSSVSSIEEGAFYDCDNLSEVIIDDISSWTSISVPYSIFPSNRMHDILIGDKRLECFNADNNESIFFNNKEAFTGCSSLKEVSFSSQTKRIGVSFSGCKNLTRVVLPENIESFSYGGFGGCINIREINLPKVLRHVEGNPFFEVPGAETIENDLRYACGWCVGGKLPKGGTVRFKDGTYGISSWLFTSAQVSEIIFPPSVKIISEYSFRFMYDLKKIVFEGRTPLCERESFYRGNNIPVEVCVNDDGWRRSARVFSDTHKFKVINTGLLQSEYEKEEAARREKIPKPPADIKILCDKCKSAFPSDRYKLIALLENASYTIHCATCGSETRIPYAICPLCKKRHVYGIDESPIVRDVRFERCYNCGESIKIYDAPPVMILQNPTNWMASDLRKSIAFDFKVRDALEKTLMKINVSETAFYNKVAAIAHSRNISTSELIGLIRIAQNDSTSLEKIISSIMSSPDR